MQLVRFEVSEFRSIRNSNPIATGDITCLVGKNEAGKTAILKALYRLNPIVEGEGAFDITDDYPRVDVEDYRQAIESQSRKPAVVIRAWFELSDAEAGPIEAEFGKGCLRSRVLELSKGYDNVRRFALELDPAVAVKRLLEAADLPHSAVEAVAQCGSDPAAVITTLAAQEQTSAVAQLLSKLRTATAPDFAESVFKAHLAKAMPKFLYFDEYYQMRGHENIEGLMQREAQGKLLPSDHPMLGLIRLARLKLPELVNPARTVELRSKLEGAGNHLSKQVLKYWSQNRHLQMRFDVRPARPGDPEDMRAGTNIWGGVYDTKHFATTELSARSRGFVWFFSFLAWYSDVKRQEGPLILLLDEPGLSLHGKAQGDLLRYFEEELKAEHQVVYSTHSPFMVDPGRFDRVRIVQDLSIDEDGELPPEKQGTKVLPDALGATDDSLFPLQGALGYELSQTLFVGPNSLVVEGVSDLLYLQTMSDVLAKEGRTQLDPRWTVTPVGGSSKVPTFVALLGSQRGMKIATLIDVQGKDAQMIEDLYKKQLLKKKNVLTFGDFVGQKEADVEDMFGEGFYLQLVNAEYKSELPNSISGADLNPKIPRVLPRIEKHFEAHPLTKGKFTHGRPAKHFASNIAALGAAIPASAKDRFEQAFRALNALL